MADTAKRLAGPILVTNAAVTYYTVPGATTAILRNIHVANESASAVTFTLSIGTDGTGKRLWKDLSIPANATLDWSGFMVMAAAEILTSIAGTTNVLVLTVSGVETT